MVYSWICLLSLLAFAESSRAEPPVAKTITVLAAPDLKALPKDVITEMILDASGSMKQKVHQRTKLYQAKRVMRAFMTQSSEDNMTLGLRVYGLHEKDCKDSQLLYKFGEKGMDAIDQAMEAVNPKGYGKTPLAYSLQKASEDLKPFVGKPRRIILVTDGADTCGGDPCKIARELKRDFDIRIYVVGYTLDPGEREQLKCLADSTGGKFFDADDLQSLMDALKGMQDPGKNLIVKSPEPLGISELYETVPGHPPHRLSQFVSLLGTHVEPNKEYEVRVRLNPVFVFPKVVVAPKEVKVLVVKGDGMVTIQFRDQLFAVQLLDDKGTPVMSFPSDVPTKVPTGFYKVRTLSSPFSEGMIDDIAVVPGGNYEEKIKGFGALQLDSDAARGPGPFGMYVFDDIKKKDLGSYLTGTPLVLPLGRYVIKTIGNAMLRNVYPEPDVTNHIPIPPPGQTVTFARREKADPNEPKGPAFLDQQTPEQVKEHARKAQESYQNPGK